PLRSLVWGAGRDRFIHIRAVGALLRTRRLSRLRYPQYNGVFPASGPPNRPATPGALPGRTRRPPVGERVDPITVSVIQHRLHAIVEEMGEAMLRTSYSQILNSSRDFSTAICDPDGRLVAQAEHVPIHVGALPWAVQSVRKFFGDRVQPGDVYLLND